MTPIKLLDGVARKHGGSVDKYLGDSIMAVFGYPVPLDEAEVVSGHQHRRAPRSRARN